MPIDELMAFSPWTIEQWATLAALVVLLLGALIMSFVLRRDLEQGHRELLRHIRGATPESERGD